MIGAFLFLLAALFWIGILALPVLFFYAAWQFYRLARSVERNARTTKK